MSFDLFYKIAFGLRTNQFIDHLAPFNEKDSRNGGNTVVHGDLWVVVNVHFTYVHFTIIFLGKFFDHGSDRTAGPAPFCPKVNYGQFIRSQHISLEVCIIEFFCHFMYFKFLDFGL